MLATAALGGCAAETITSSLPKPAALAAEPTVVDGSPSDVYGRIASGALSCWFAVNGQLKKSHIFHADADPPAKGGAVEIAIHEREKDAPRPWGAKAYKIALAASSTHTTIEITNVKMPAEIAQQMRADVFGWAQGETTCRLKPEEVVPPPEPPAKSKSKVKPKVKAATP